MKDSAGYLRGRASCFEQSMSALADVCEELSLDPQSSRKLAGLATGVAPPSSANLCEFGPRGALEILGHARADLGLLVSGGSAVERDGDELRSALDDLEVQLGRELRRRAAGRVCGLYVIIDPEVTGGRDPVEVARGALRGGARMIQMRDKLREKGQVLALARELKGLCSQYDALFMVNDHADLASVVNADGLHVGQGDMPVAECRKVLSPHQIVGRSNHLLEEVLESEAQGADHVALGSIYPTTTKASIIGRAPTGPEAVRKAKQTLDLPLVAIGGITEDNVEAVVVAGADAICVTSAVGLAQDPEEASRRLVEIMRRAGGKD